MIKAAAILTQILELIESVPMPERLWLHRSLKAYMSGSSPGVAPVQTRFNEPVHAPGANGHFAQEGVVVAFSSFWSLYPKRKGKKEALRIWLRIQPDSELQRRILQALHEQIPSEQWTRENGRFIPLPKTWLNQGAWDDEPEVQMKNAPRFGRTDARVFKRFIDRGHDDPQ